ncbi:conserved hypothetical protein [Histoplasma capsulatum var. duboisii H88]|uniref:RNA polymerase I-specific transcription initiation factor rrn11 n=1 Tax=Ajellomyces capsulatus (strain H88) TaxID=544711 RepID=F0URQ3_AJEC8|nr:conserved hypothetical protein [Histoplasma capsulatum var. duboisii H88]QSS50587.1 hypothetical protein I7I53_11334 [Histoplasma capsulatum var. duboisii H88]
MSLSYFSLPLATWQQPASWRTARYEANKRKQNDHIEVDEVSTASTSDDDAGVASNPQNSADDGKGTRSCPKSPIVLSPNEAHQYRVAGLPFHRALPGGSFPHSRPGPSKSKPSRISQREIERELSQLSPPIFIPSSTDQNNSLRLLHLNVITTILHRCLLEGDYARAGRAWGLILRDEFGGHGMDVRSSGRWGIGAEILLWSDRNPIAESSASLRTGNADSANFLPRRQWFTRRGFERAKSYYERLILQFPYRKAAPTALSPLDFYPAMFGLWISLVQEESQSARDAVVMDMQGMTETYDFDNPARDDNMSISGAISQQPDSRNNRKEDTIVEARRKELEEAQQIAAQMDELLISPPFSDSYELLRLRGMLSLWIADLFVLSVFPENDDMSNVPCMRDFDGDQTMFSDDDAGYTDSVLARMEQGSGMHKKMAEVEKANVFFEKAKATKAKASRKQTSLPPDEVDEDDSVI